MNRIKPVFLFFSFHLLLSAFCSLDAGQTRLTTHTNYIPSADGQGRILYFRHDSGENLDLYRMNADGSGNTRLSNDFTWEYSVAPFADGTRIAVLKKSEDYDYLVINNSGSESTIYQTPNFIKGYAVSPDNTKLSFIEYDPSTSKSILGLVGSGGESPRSLAPGFAEPGLINNAPRLVFSLTGSTVTEGNISGYVYFSSDSKKLVYLNSSSRIAVINDDGTGYTVISTFTVNTMRYLSDGRIMFVRFDSGYILGTVNFDGSGYSIHYSTNMSFYDFYQSPDQTKAAIVIEGKIIVVSLSSGLLYTWDITGKTVPYYRPWLNDSKLIITDDNKDIYLLNIADGMQEKITSNGRDPAYYLFTVSDKRIVYSVKTDYYNKAEKKVYSIRPDGSGNTLLLTVPAGQSQDNTRISPDGNKALYSLSSMTTSYIYLMNTDGTGSPQLIEQDFGMYMELQWSPTGAYFSFKKGSNYFIANADGSNIRQVTFPEFSNINYLFFSETGDRILFRGFSNPFYRICTAAIELSTYTVAGSTNTNLYIKDWKAGKILLGNTALYMLSILNETDGSFIPVAGNAYVFNKAFLAPDGSSLMYMEQDNSLNHLNLANSVKTKLSEGNYYNSFSYSPDGSRIAFLKYKRKNSSLNTISLANSDGSSVSALNSSVGNTGDIFFASNSKICYLADGDIWTGDYSSFLSIPPDAVKPESRGEVKIVVPEGAGEKGTVNPDNNVPVSIGFKGSAGGQFTLRVFTQLGELVHESSKTSDTADGWFEWLPGNLASGIYFVHVDGPGVKIFKKVALLR